MNEADKTIVYTAMDMSFICSKQKYLYSLNINGEK